MSFHEDGYEMFTFLTEAELQDVTDAITDCIDNVARALQPPFEYSHPELPFETRLEAVAQKDQSYAAILWHAVCGDVQRDPRIARLVEHPVLVAKAAELVGAPIVGGTVRVRANVPSFSEHRHKWHSDVVRLTGGSCSKIKMTCWTPLVPVSSKNGSLEIAPGRPRDAPLPHETGKDDPSFHIPDEVMAPHPKKVVQADKGASLLMDRFTPHQAMRNETGTVRWAVAVWLRTEEMNVGSGC